MKKLHIYFNKVIEIFLSIMLFAMVVVVFLQVVYRFVLKMPLAWTSESATFLLIWLTFLGAAFAMSTRAHIGIELFVNLFPKGMQKVLSVLAWLLSSFFFYIMVTEGANLAERTMNQSSPTLDIPMGVVYYIIPASGVILFINMTVNVWKDLRGEAE